MNLHQKIKKGLVLILSMAIVVSMGTINVFAGETTKGTKIEWDKTLDFTTAGENTPPADCTKLSTGAHTHSKEEDKCFTWENNTLKLNNLNLETSAATAIKLPADAKVVMEGNSVVTSAYTGTDPSNGIKGNGALTFSGTGALNVTGGTSTNSFIASCGVYCKDIIISAGTLTATGGTSSESYGVNAFSDITVNGTGSLIGTGGQAKENSYGVNAFSDITVNNTGSLIATGGTAINSIGVSTQNGITKVYDNGKLEGTGDTATSNSIGVSAQNGITVNDTGSLIGTGGTTTYASSGVNSGQYVTVSGNGKLEGTGGQTPTSSTGVYALSDLTVENAGSLTGTGKIYGVFSDTAGNITVSGGTFEAKCGADSPKSAVNEAPDTASYTNVKLLAGETVGNLETVKDLTDFAQYKHIKIEQDTKITTALDFTIETPLADCTELSTKAHTHSNEADKCFTWDKDSNTLTLNNLDLETTAATAITLPAGAEVVMGGDSTVISKYENAGGHSHGIYGNGALTFSGTGTLKSTGGNISHGIDCYSYGVSAVGDIIVSEGGLTGIGGPAHNNSYGVYSESGNIEVSSNGNLEGTGGQADSNSNSYGVHAEGNIEVSGNGKLKGTGGQVDSDSNSYGVSAGGNIEVSDNGKLEGTGGQAGKNSYGVIVDDTYNITINGGTVTASSTNTTENATAQAMYKMPIKADSTTWAVRTGNTAQDATTNSAFNAVESFKYIIIEAAPTPPSGGGSYVPLAPTITIESDEVGVAGGTAVYDKSSNKLTITPAEGYQIKDVTVNGKSKGAVSELTGIYGTETIKVIFEKKAPEKTPEQLQAEKDAKITAGVKAARIIYMDGNQLKKGKVKLTWKRTTGFKMDYYQVFRSSNKTKGFKKSFETKNRYYITGKNLTSGKNIYFKVRGIRKVGNIKVYTEFSRVESVKIK